QIDHYLLKHDGDVERGLRAVEARQLQTLAHVDDEIADEAGEPDEPQVIGDLEEAVMGLRRVQSGACYEHIRWGGRKRSDPVRTVASPKERRQLDVFLDDVPDDDAVGEGQVLAGQRRERLEQQ